MPHPDLGLVGWIREQLLIIIPRLTTEFWKHKKKIDIERKLDAKIDLLYTKKNIDEVNENLADAMEVEAEGKEVVRSIACDEAKKSKE